MVLLQVLHFDFSFLSVLSFSLVIKGLQGLLHLLQTSQHVTPGGGVFNLDSPPKSSPQQVVVFDLQHSDNGCFFSLVMLI
jgi:hypothetical protein